MSDENIDRTVKFTLDLENPTPLTAEEVAQLEQLRRSDDEIDFSDIPSQAGTVGWTRPGLFGGPMGAIRLQALKEGVLMLDEDVAAMYGADEAGRTARMNAVLREFGRTQKTAA